MDKIAIVTEIARVFNLFAEKFDLADESALAPTLEHHDARCTRLGIPNALHAERTPNLGELK
jgi:hypothetical protein